MDMAGLLGRLFRRQRTPELRCSAVVPAAGSSTRMEGQDKLLLPLEEQPVLLHTLRALELCPYLAEIIVVTREDLIVPIGQLCRDAGLSKVRKVIVGGATRTHSVLAGLGELPSGAELVAIHDGARPLVSQEVLETVIFRAAECGAAAPAVPVKDTIKRARDSLVEATLERSELFAVQTPQVFQVDLIKAALVKALEDGAALTDDCGAAGHRRIPDAGGLLQFENHHPGGSGGGGGAFRLEGAAVRIGHGYDVHRLVEGRRLILGGVEVPFDKGLLGHSDADVLTHAVMDALLGACALGDIGHLFPDSDPAYAGADSLRLLDEVVSRLRQRGYRVGNVDATVLAQAPKLAPYLEQMRRNLAWRLQVPVDAVSVKATTEEGLGFTGTGDGIAAHAVCLVENLL